MSETITRITKRPIKDSERSLLLPANAFVTAPPKFFEKYGSSFEEGVATRAPRSMGQGDQTIAIDPIFDLSKWKDSRSRPVITKAPETGVEKAALEAAGATEEEAEVTEEPTETEETMESTAPRRGRKKAPKKKGK